MKYTNYKLEDFIRDEYFKSWVVNPDEDSDFFWESFIKHNPQRVSELVKAREIIQSLSFGQKQPPALHTTEKEQIWSAILSGEQPGRQNHIDMITRRPAVWFSMSPVSRVAAVLIAAFLISLIWFGLSPRKVPDVKHTVRMFTKQTEKGEKLSTKLPDGSVVVLNADSWIEYPEAFSDSTRSVRLGGEAFFDIARDPMHPFVIESGQFKTEVLGTSFAIREDQESGRFNLAVVSGRVAVTDKMSVNEENVVYVEPKQTVYFNRESNDFHFTTFDYAELISWKDGVLYFNNANFDEIVRKLENWYGVTISIRASLDRKKDFTGQFVNEKLDEVLRGLSFTFGFEYEIKQNNVTINKKS